MASNLRAMASYLRAMASNLVAMAFNLVAMASSLVAMASKLRAMACFQEKFAREDPFQPRLGARTLLGAPGRTADNKKLLGTKGIATRSKDATSTS